MYPLISCICITRQRPGLLEKAIDCFQNQTYPNKELVIAVEDRDQETLDFLKRKKQMQGTRVVIIKSEAVLTLGALRNRAISEASGHFVSQWDDDDWYHPEKLLYQYNLLTVTALPATVLGKIIIYDGISGKAYLSCYRHWEGTILYTKETALKYPYSNLKRGEDTPVISSLVQNKILHTDNTVQPLYIYRYHGANTWDYRHFQGFFPFSRLLPDAIALTAKKLLEEPGVAMKDVMELDNLFYKTYPDVPRNSQDHSPAL